MSEAGQHRRAGKIKACHCDDFWVQRARLYSIYYGPDNIIHRKLAINSTNCCRSRQGGISSVDKRGSDRICHCGNGQTYGYSFLGYRKTRSKVATILAFHDLSDIAVLRNSYYAIGRVLNTDDPRRFSVYYYIKSSAILSVEHKVPILRQQLIFDRNISFFARYKDYLTRRFNLPSIGSSRSKHLERQDKVA